MKQPEALRLAIQLEREWINDSLNYDTAQNAWVELRRLHEVNQELLGFVKEYVEAWNDGMAGDSYLLRIANAAFAKATGEQA